MGEFTAKLQAFEEKTVSKLRRVDTNFKLKLANRIVATTRIAQPLTWVRPQPDYPPGTMRGNWIVEKPGAPGYFDPARKNTTHYLAAGEMKKIARYSTTILANYTPYVMVYERLDGMVGRAAAALRQDLWETVQEVKAQ